MAKSKEDRELQLRRLEEADWPEDPAEFLRAAGWTYLPPAERPAPRSCWREPVREVAATVKTEGRLKVRDGIFKEHTQHQVAAEPWCYPTEEAVRIQLGRDRPAQAK